VAASVIYTRSPLAYVVSLAILIGGGVWAAIKIKGAFESSNRVDQEARRLDLLSQGKLGSSMLIPGNLTRALGQVRAQVGPDAKVVSVVVNTTSAEFAYLARGRVAGLQETSVRPVLEPRQETFDDPGSPRLAAFSLRLLDPTVPARFVPAIRRLHGLGDFSMSSATLARDVLTHKPDWTISGTGGGRDLVLQARPDGGGLKRLPG
jgi:hypothetical protein